MTNKERFCVIKKQIDIQRADKNVNDKVVYILPALLFFQQLKTKECNVKRKLSPKRKKKRKIKTIHFVCERTKAS